MPRRYNVEGKKTYLYWAVGLLALGVWAVKDGWFPSADIIKKYGEPGWTNFYSFNRSLAALSLSAAAVCAYIHRIVK